MECNLILVGKEERKGQRLNSILKVIQSWSCGPFCTTNDDTFMVHFKALKGLLNPPFFIPHNNHIVLVSSSSSGQFDWGSSSLFWFFVISLSWCRKFIHVAVDPRRCLWGSVDGQILFGLYSSATALQRPPAIHQVSIRRGGSQKTWLNKPMTSRTLWPDPSQWVRHKLAMDCIELTKVKPRSSCSRVACGDIIALLTYLNGNVNE